MIKLEILEQKFQIDPDHAWGYQVRMVNTPKYAAKLLVMTNDTPGSLHHHNADKLETFIVLKGKVIVELPDGKHELEPGDIVHIPHYIMHKHWAPDAGKSETQEAVILEVSTHDDDNFTYKLSDSEVAPTSQDDAFTHRIESCARVSYADTTHRINAKDNQPISDSLEFK